MQKETLNVSPFLFQFAIPRTGSDEIPGHYDSLENVWVVEDEGGVVPLITKAAQQAELVTKTKQQVESDDQTFVCLSEVTTKTEAQRERDDAAPSVFNSLLMLSTKTSAQLERDD